MTTNQRDILAALLTIIHASGNDLKDLPEKAVKEYSAVRLAVEEIDIRENYAEQLEKFRKGITEVMEKCGFTR